MEAGRAGKCAKFISRDYGIEDVQESLAAGGIQYYLTPHPILGPIRQQIAREQAGSPIVTEEIHPTIGP
jgi:hypothetical protein